MRELPRSAPPVATVCTHPKQCRIDQACPEGNRALRVLHLPTLLPLPKRRRVLLLPLLMRAVDELQRQTIREEERLTARLAGLQEDMADQPISAIAKGIDWIGEMSGEIEKVLNEHERSMVEVLEEDDKLRLNTLKEILGILHPVQGVDFWP
ncbi:hypothetical protein L484_023805 [Morus notabilis]|uniref:DOG1 domain-containing protein n=1 Tax=Morus notabilis TaxID=981085 RepID=W9RDB6_9ROSA|nr:hypothetical protein L484_023805 [Morus notabilis]